MSNLTVEMYTKYLLQEDTQTNARRVSTAILKQEGFSLTVEEVKDIHNLALTYIQKEGLLSNEKLAKYIAYVTIEKEGMGSNTAMLQDLQARFNKTLVRENAVPYFRELVQLAMTESDDNPFRDIVMDAEEAIAKLLLDQSIPVDDDDVEELVWTLILRSVKIFHGEAPVSNLTFVMKDIVRFVNGEDEEARFLAMPYLMERIGLLTGVYDIFESYTGTFYMRTTLPSLDEGETYLSSIWTKISGMSSALIPQFIAPKVGKVPHYTYTGMSRKRSVALCKVSEEKLNLLNAIPFKFDEHILQMEWEVKTHTGKGEEIPLSMQKAAIHARGVFIEIVKFANSKNLPLYFGNVIDTRGRSYCPHPNSPKADKNTRAAHITLDSAKCTVALQERKNLQALFANI